VANCRRQCKKNPTLLPLILARHEKLFFHPIVIFKDWGSDSRGLGSVLQPAEETDALAAEWIVAFFLLRGFRPDRLITDAPSITDGNNQHETLKKDNRFFAIILGRL